MQVKGGLDFHQDEGLMLGSDGQMGESHSYHLNNDIHEESF